MQHCRGEASDVPRLVRDALGADPDAAKSARNALFDGLFYQGSSFEPTSHAGRFLVRAMPHVTADQREWLVGFARSLADAYTMTEGMWPRMRIGNVALAMRPVGLVAERAFCERLLAP